MNIVDQAKAIRADIDALVEAADPKVLKAHIKALRPWKKNTSYQTGALVRHGNKVYQCLKDHISSQLPDKSPEIWQEL